eukprot:3577367-Pyramimonas_sp.AAC.1
MVVVVVAGEDELRRPRISANETIRALIAETLATDEIDYQWRAVWNSKLLSFNSLHWINNQLGVHLVSRNHYQYAVLIGIAAATVLCLFSVWHQYRVYFISPASGRLNPAALSLSATTLTFGATRDPETFKYRKHAYGAQPGSAFYLSQPPVDLETAPSYREQRSMRFKL